MECIYKAKNIPIRYTTGMNPIKNEQQLSIVLPSHNRAFAEAIKNATAQQLAVLHETISPQNLISEFFGDAIKEEKSKQVLLELVKNSPLLKDLGSMHTSLSNLAELLKDEPKFQNTLKLIEAINKEDATPNPKEIHQKIADSGVFLESKLSRFLQPTSELSSGLKDLVGVLQNSTEEKVKPIIHEINKLLPELESESTVTKENPKPALAIRQILSKLDLLTSQADSIHSKDSLILFDKLKSYQGELLSTASPKNAENLANSIVHLYKSLIMSKDKDSATLLKLLEPVLHETKNSVQKAHSNEAGIKETLTNLKNAPQWKNALQSLKNDTELLQKLNNSPLLHKQAISQMEHFLQPNSAVHWEALKELKSTFQSLLSMIKPMPLIEEVHNSLEKILFRFTPNDLFPKELEHFISKYETVLQKSDPLYSKEILNLQEKLMRASGTNHLPSSQALKETLQNDLKAELLKALDEIKSSPELSKRNELTLSVEKALTIIDYHQLVSHLSQATSIYLPIHWEMLEEGNIKFKKREKEKFYCEIDLKLVEFGKLNLLMAIFGDNQLEIQIHTEQEKLQHIIQENLPLLRSYLISAGLHPRQMRVFEPKKQKASPYSQYPDDPPSGFEEKA